MQGVKTLIEALWARGIEVYMMTGGFRSGAVEPQQRQIIAAIQSVTH